MPFCDYQGLFLPAFGKSESEWPNNLRRVLYVLGLVWCFIGIGVISDVFMNSIEKITSKKKRVKNKATGRLVTVSVWNETVSNLTLMALGSSAPEIMLSLVEIILVQKMYIGALGPSTIIGSAAFNLLCISAVCVAAIPNNEIRYIKEVQVYVITASFSIFAYLWLILILQVWSPNVVTIVEGLITLLFFPVLILAAYLADIGYFSTKDPEKDELNPGRMIASEMTADELAQLEHKIREEHGRDLTDDLVHKIMEAQYFHSHSRAYYHRAGMGAALGAKRKLSSVALPTTNLFSVSADCRTHDDVDAEAEARTISVGFSAGRYAVLENCGHAKIPIILSQAADRPITVKYKTKEGTAQEHEDFKPLDDIMHFMPGEVEKIVAIQIVDDVAYEDNEEFYIHLSDPQFAEAEEGHAESNNPADLSNPSQANNFLQPVASPQESEKSGMKIKLSELSVTTVLIIDDDDPGQLRFMDEQLTVCERKSDHVETIVVERFNGGSGNVGCKYYTEASTAKPGYDYEDTEGILDFKHGQLTATIDIPIKAVGRYDLKEEFRVLLKDPTGGAKFDKTTDGGEESCILTVVIKANDEHKPRITKMMSAFRITNQKDPGHQIWRKQFRDAIRMGDDDDDDDDCQPGVFDYFMHGVALPWKFLFALVPPPEYCQGWACFVCSLFMIGVVTAVVSDMASLVGCTIGIKDEVTAITFVALGTSLPDTFASKTAATLDPYADASIGNVTGSNSVNVFLGLGLPWTIAAIYWAAKGDVSEWRAHFLPASLTFDGEPGKFFNVPDVLRDYPDGAFTVPAGSLWFNLTIYTVCALSAIALLAVRRTLHGGELGGPTTSKYVSAALLVSLWLFYVCMSTWWVYREDD